MNVEITDAAVAFYQNEMNLTPGDQLRLFVRVGGVGSGGFSVGITREIEGHNYEMLEKKGIQFFVAKDDLWYIDGMKIDYDDDRDMVMFTQSKFDNLDHPLFIKET
ncbi:iron-sulfur cluster biosynthesis family protein [Shouchella sp. 1P09AA]|uniref:iron-sulfur cluster biosynthesis family protein n=1 Tax=unclassified Shouchella TaxID=2893065 RepID=UPI00399F977B